jgi:starch synthase
MGVHSVTRVLCAVSEVYPLTKTGGLGDVAYSLPHALHRVGADVRLVLPAYRSVLMQLTNIRILGWLMLTGAEREHSVRILETRPEGFDFPVWLVDCPVLFDRPGNPYVDEDGRNWTDNAERFAVLSRAVVALAQDRLSIGWTPDVVHANDWQTGLVPVLLSNIPQRPKSVFTIHNLAYGGHFSLETYHALDLPRAWWRVDGVEFYGGFSMLKAGIVYADEVTTVSPTYAREICTAEYGCGLEGVLQVFRQKLHGILNGIDESVWDPQTDPYLSAHYSAERRHPGKVLNKQAILHHFNMFCDERCLQVPLIGMVSRLVAQKGVDLVLAAMPHWLEQTDARFVVVGSGQAEYEQQWLALQAQYPQRIGVFIGYDEMLAHLVEAGADMFLMPSRFEPCGLNQMYSLRYGTPPIVYRTGGLADTVFDATDEHVVAGIANGFVFDEMSVAGLQDAVARALACYAQHRRWQALQRTGMRQSFGWDHSAAAYMALYRGLPAMREKV